MHSHLLFMLACYIGYTRTHNIKYVYTWDLNHNRELKTCQATDCHNHSTYYLDI